MVKFAVCEDEQEMADYISDKLREYYPEECEIKKYGDGESLLNVRRREFFDALFLDIGLPGMSGIELAKKIRKDDPYVKIIFVTKREELAHMGYLFNVFRFVRKSNLNQELCETADSLKEYFDSLDKYMSFNTPTGKITRAVKDIKYFEVKGHAITMVSVEYEDQVCGTMKMYCDIMKNKGFIQIHKSYLVNFRYIYSVEKDDVRLPCGKVLPLSRNRVDEVKNKLQDFLIHIGR
ncbi:MAG: response regulator transcription factor [Ruminococcaceae bacterium]|nr:response regulator transcription factor [Oscillospiraceae bacterium]